MIHQVNVEFRKNYYPAYWVNENEFLGMIRPDELDNRVRLIGGTKYWFDVDEEVFYFSSESYDLFEDAVEGLHIYTL